jgi:hypothetical protein
MLHFEGTAKDIEIEARGALATEWCSDEDRSIQCLESAGSERERATASSIEHRASRILEMSSPWLSSAQYVHGIEVLNSLGRY